MIIVTNKNIIEPVSVTASRLLDSAVERSCKFTPSWIKEEGEEKYTLYVPEVDVFGVGPTKEAAIESLIETVQEYAALFFGDLRYYLSPAVSRKNHIGYLRCIIRCNGDSKKIREVLGL